MVHFGAAPYDRLFEGFPPDEAEKVLAAGAPRAFRRGEAVFREGEPASALFLVESGRVKLTQVTAGGQEVILRYLAPGDAFAAVALFDNATYPATAEATERTRLRAWGREALPALVREHPRFEANLLRIVSSHTHEALSRVREMATETAAQRVARALLRLSGQIGRRQPDGSVLLEHLAQQEVADIAGTTVYTVSRTLAEWQDRGIAETGRRRFRLLDPGRLAEIAGISGTPGREG